MDRAATSGAMGIAMDDSGATAVRGEGAHGGIRAEEDRATAQHTRIMVTLSSCRLGVFS